MMTLWTAMHGFLTWLVPAAAAQMAPYPPCGSLPGCGTKSNVLATSTLPTIALFMVRLAGGLSVVFIAWAGISMMINMGDESKVTKARWAVIYSLLGLSLAVCAQLIVGFVATENVGQGNTGDLIIGGILPRAVQILVIVLNVIFAIVIIIAGIRLAMTQGKADEFGKAKTALIWAIGGAILVNMARALATAVVTVFGVN